MTFFISGFDFSLPICRVRAVGGRRNLPDGKKKQVSGSGIKSELKKSKRMAAPPQFEAAKHVLNAFEARRVHLGS